MHEAIDLSKKAGQIADSNAEGGKGITLVCKNFNGPIVSEHEEQQDVGQTKPYVEKERKGLKMSGVCPHGRNEESEQGKWNDGVCPH